MENIDQLRRRYEKEKNTILFDRGDYSHYYNWIECEYITQQKQIEELKAENERLTIGNERWASELDIQIGWLNEEKKKTAKLKERVKELEKENGKKGEWRTIGGNKN